MAGYHKTLQLKRGEELLQSNIINSKAHKELIINRWKHLYGKKFPLLKIVEIKPKNEKMETKKENDPLERLKKLINEGFKEYDGDIREEALECLTEIDFLYKTICSQSETQADDVDNLTTECEKLKVKLFQIEEHEIDFGTGKLYFSIHKGSSMSLINLMSNIKNAALVVPLHALADSIKKAPGYPHL